MRSPVVTKAKATQTARDKAIEAAVSQFMKSIDHATRREIEKRLRKALADGVVKPGDSITAGMGLKSPDADLDVAVFGKIKL
ncbi:DUF6494 family protein [Undibacter mobilis]|uniref:Uncharacterized protein n=1 Tax=Undibacter mobilis TaxID=2292256 RepID=A0A371B7P7_9BRAD|nr:DUF6494 family protein [Undibacter mobilis]RDV03473.1 hypothetical protein DXH78_02015 [Undibacter mobilis]